MNIESLINYFLPKSYNVGNEEKLRKTIVSIICCSIGALIFLTYGISYYFVLDASYLLKFNITIATLLILNIFAFKKGLPLEVMTNISVALIVIGINNASLCLGREKTMGIYFLNVIPLAVGLYLSRKQLIFWSVVCVLSYPFQEYIGGTYLAHLEIPLSEQFKQRLWSSSYYVNLGIIVTFVFIYMQTLKRSLAMLKKKSETAHSLLRVITHDVSNPLTIIQNSARLIRDKNLSKENINMWANKIFLSSEMINSITNQVRQIEALESGKNRIELSSVNILNVINSVIENYETQLQNKEIEIQVSSPEDSKEIFVMSDKVSLTHQVVSNIISNAIKFSTEKQKINITVQINELQVIVDFKDNGIGIPTRTLRHIFSNEVPTTRKGTQGEIGTGFGMPILKEYMQLYQGEVQVVSKDISEFPSDHGTIITLTFNKAE